jgi:hypothetical protein
MIHASGFSWAALFRRMRRRFRLSLRTTKETHLPEQRAGIVRAHTEKEALMNQMDYKEALNMLRRAGFTTPEIDRLRRLRRECAAQEMHWTLADLHRLEFVRWLVMTGRLTDHII